MTRISKPKLEDLKAKEMSEEKIIITLREIVEKFKSEDKELDLEEIEKVPLTCGNCGFRGILIQFVRIRGYLTSSLYTWRWQVDSVLDGDARAKTISVKYRGDLVAADAFFVCPKCESGLVFIEKRELARMGLMLL